jgi:hypothetical protein
MSPKVAIGVALTSLLGLGANAWAADPVATRARCTAAYEQAQELRHEERLQAARAQLVICGETCPGSFARDCATWLREIDALIPTVRVIVRGSDGREVTDARLSIDGQTVALKAGESIAVEPGARAFRFTRPGSLDTELRVEVYAGERDHPVDVMLPNAPPPSPPAASPDRAPPASTTPAPSRAGSFVAGGIGVGALATAGVLLLKGHIDRDSLESSCEPRCTEDEVDGIRTAWTASAVSAGIGAIALGVAILLWPKEAPRSVRAALGRNLGYGWLVR